MKKVLIISHDFPPMGLGSVQRVVKFIKYFPIYDWEPIVLTSTPKKYFARDEFLLDEVNLAGAKIYRTPVRGSRNFLNDIRVTPFPNKRRRNFFSKLFSFFFIPDSPPSSRSWKRKALKISKEIFTKHKIDLIFSTAPPFNDFLIGAELREKYGIPLVIDYRDSWLDSSFKFYPTPLHKFINSKLEKKVLQTADKVITINRRIKELILEQYHNLTHDDISIVPHFFDQDEIDSAKSMLPKTNKMRFTYAGTFINLYNPDYFFEALQVVFKRKPELRKKIEICFAGEFSKEDLNLILKYNLEGVSFIVGYVNHNEYVKYLLSSDVLLLFINNGKGSEMLSTVKLSEYFGARKPVLACIPEGVAKASLKKYDAVKICEPDDVNAIAETILEYYELFDKNNLPVPNEKVIDNYNCEKLTQHMVRQFEFLLDVRTEFVRKDTV
ncbi:MAG: glycosyltransferase family 4 protein [Ignavibacteria bacterium]